MAYIGDVAHVPDLKPQVFELAINDVKTHKSAAIAEMHVIVNSGSANVYTNKSFMQWGEDFLLPCQTIVNCELIVHGAKIRIFVKNFYMIILFYI